MKLHKVPTNSIQIGNLYNHLHLERILVHKSLLLRIFKQGLETFHIPDYQMLLPLNHKEANLLTHLIRLKVFNKSIKSNNNKNYRYFRATH